MNGYCGRIGLVALTWVCLLSTGCATLQFPWEDDVARATIRNPVVQVLCLWEPAEGRDPDGHTCRGFAGQIIFLGNKGGTPVAVDGKVRVKTYDQISGPAESSKPLHQFDFDARSWDMHLHVGTLGATYNVFIPYMRKGNHEAHCELQVEFTPTTGMPVMSATMPLLLKSKMTQKEISAAAAANSLIPITSKVDPDRSSRTTTISLDGSKPVTDLSSREQAMAAQLERMERMMQEFAAQQAAKSAQPMARITADEEPKDVAARFSMSGGRIQQASATVTAPETAVTHASARIPAAQTPHNYLSAHPLAAEDAPPSTAEAASIAQRPARRHPLADEPAFANDRNRSPAEQAAAPAPTTLVVPEELTDAPVWMREENSAGRATLSDDLDGQTTQVP